MGSEKRRESRKKVHDSLVGKLSEICYTRDKMKSAHIFQIYFTLGLRTTTIGVQTCGGEEKTLTDEASFNNMTDGV